MSHSKRFKKAESEHDQLVRWVILFYHSNSFKLNSIIFSIFFLVNCCFISQFSFTISTCRLELLHFKKLFLIAQPRRSLACFVFKMSQSKRRRWRNKNLEVCFWAITWTSRYNINFVSWFAFLIIHLYIYM